MAKIYLLYSTDIWKRNASLIWVGTSKLKLKKFVENEIKENDMSYADEELIIKEQLGHLNDDWKTLDIHEINNHLIYGFIDYVDDNSEV